MRIEFGAKVGIIELNKYRIFGNISAFMGCYFLFADGINLVKAQILRIGLAYILSISFYLATIGGVRFSVR